MLPRLARARAKISPYLRHWGTVALVAGFIFDNLTLKRIDAGYAQAILAAYLAVAASGWLVLTASDAGRFRGKFGERLTLWCLVISQFALGNLFSGFMVFYARSGAWIATWPFLVLLILLLIGNETLKRHYSSLVFRFLVLYVGLFLFLIFHLPIVFGRLGSDIFLLASAASLVIMAGYHFLSEKISPQVTRPLRRSLLVGSLTIAVLINLLYLSNILPPIPLSLKDAGIYHNLKRTPAGYSAETEPERWYQRLSLTETIHYRPGQALYAYSAVFAPTKLNTTIVHEWQRYDETKKGWVSEARIPIAISGGRDGGYRGYSLKSALRPSEWRVNIKTSRGQLLGRIKFKAIETDTAPNLISVDL